MPAPSPDAGVLVGPDSTDGGGGGATPATTAESPDVGYVKRKLGFAFWLGLAWAVLVIGGALLAPWLTNRGILQDPIRSDPVQRFQLGSSKHPLGTDSLGRDQFSRLVWGARVSLPVGFASIALGLVVGISVGVVAGYLKGWVDSVLMTVMDIILAFPALLLALSVVTFTDKKDVAHISVAIGIIAIPAMARLVRANTLTFREREFVLAARTLGATHSRIITREILPIVVMPVMSFAVIGVAVAIAAEGALAFLGVSVPLPTATWGGMINEARGTLATNPYQVFVPCGFLVATIISFYLIGDRLGQFLNIKETAL